MQSGMPSNHLRGHQPELLHRDIDFTGYPLTYKEAPRPIGAAIFAASPEIDFFNRIGQLRPLAGAAQLARERTFASVRELAVAVDARWRHQKGVAVEQLQRR